MTKEQAEAKGAALLNRIRGTGWKVHVWENMGWHYAVHKGGLHVHSSFDMEGMEEKYFTLFSSSGNVGGEIFWTNHLRHHDPNVLIKRQLDVAQEFVDKCQGAINAVREEKTP